MVYYRTCVVMLDLHMVFLTDFEATALGSLEHLVVEVRCGISLSFINKLVQRRQQVQWVTRGAKDPLGLLPFYLLQYWSLQQLESLSPISR